MTSSVSFNQIVSAAIIFGMLACPVALAAVIHVPSEAGTVQAGIDSAVDGDTVLVASGIYSGVGNEAIRFNGKRIVVKSESGPEATILRTLGTVRTVIFDHAEDSNAVLEGFTITGGYETDFDWSYSQRGGIYSSTSSTVRNCVISGCYAYEGGGVYLEGGSPSLINCVIDRNRSIVYGGGVFANCYWAKLRNCRIINNQVHGSGHNTNADGGGVCSMAGRISISGCYIAQNRAGILNPYYADSPSTRHGGGVASFVSMVYIDSSIIAQNSAGYGGAIFALCRVNLYPLSVTNTYIYNNVADSYASIAAEVRNDPNTASIQVVNNTIVCNYSAKVSSDGIVIKDSFPGTSSAPKLNDTLSVDSDQTLGSGSGILTVRNNIFAFNSSTPISIGVDQVATDIGYNDIWYTVSGPNYGGMLADLTGIDGNISSDPLFCQISDSICTLDATSPCATAGELGSHMGLFDIACDMYGGVSPQQHSVTFDPADSYNEDANQGILDSSLAVCRPWDTLIVNYAANTCIYTLTVDKPLYLFGTGLGSEAFLHSNVIYGYANCINVESFCILDQLQVQALAMTTTCHATGIQCTRGAPIIRNTAAEAADWHGLDGHDAILCMDDSPLIRNCALMGQWDYLEVIGNDDVVASDNFWYTSNPSNISRYYIVDGYDYPGSGYALFEPYLLDFPTDVTDGGTPEPVPTEFDLSQNYPNPFNMATTISYELPAHAHVSLIIYNLLGQTVKKLVDADHSAGTYDVVWDGTDSGGHVVSSGIYLYRLCTGPTALCRKMILLK